MPMEPGRNFLKPIDVLPSQTEFETELGLVLTPSSPLAPASNLAALLDRFTDGITNPDTQTIGSFAATVDALHGELVLLAHHFGGGVAAASDVIDFDDVFPDVTPSAGEQIEPGIAASEELEHLCRELSGAQ